TGESGKSTLVKQMKVIYNEGFSDEELLSFRPTILDNLLSSMKYTLAGMGLLRIRLGNSRNKSAAKLVLSHPAIPPVGENETNYYYTLGEETIKALEALWRDKGVRTAVLRGHEYELNDSALYLFENMQRLTSEKYEPTVRDVLRARVRTNGVIETEFIACQGALRARVLDAGIPLNSATPYCTVSKWMRWFEDVRAVIFVVALSGYDMLMQTEPNINRLQDSMDLFRKIATNRYFQNCLMVLFLNKMDLFREKILHSKRHLRYYFSEFRGPDENVDSAALFVQGKLLEAIQRPVFPHFTTAVDTANVKAVFETVLSTILKRNIDAYQLL
ncbi:guanine nucleotide-binding protein G(o) subunit alpha-like, partial [Tropilaelaps mercedesae]